MNNMTEKEKFDYLIEKGYYATECGKVISFTGKSVAGLANGYLEFSFRKDKKKLRVYNHRFIYYFFHKQIPNQVDHINQVRSDNRLKNLRNVSHQENQLNTKAKGYCWCRTKKRWKSRITIHSKIISLGYFDNENEAREAYLKAKEIYHTI